MTKDKALKLAIDAMTYHIEQTRPIKVTAVAIQACKEALAEQPTNMVTVPLDVLEDMQRRLRESPIGIDTFSDTEHKCEGCVKCDARCLPTQELNDLLTYGQSFEKEGKSIPIDEVYYPPKQEPMIIKQDNGMVLKQGFDDLPNGTPFYTHPSKQWQGLSDDEIFKIEGLDCVDEEYIKRFARAIEAELRELNG